MTSGLEVDGGLFAAVLLDLVGDFLAFVEAVEACALDGADMDEYVLAAAVRLNEAITLVPLNHFTVPVAMFSPRQSARDCALAG